MDNLVGDYQFTEFHNHTTEGTSYALCVLWSVREKSLIQKVHLRHTPPYCTVHPIPRRTLTPYTPVLRRTCTA